MVLKNIRETLLDKKLTKVQKYLRYNALIAVPFDKGAGFSVMQKSTYAEKLEKVLDFEQFRNFEKRCDHIVMKDEKKTKQRNFFGYEEKWEEVRRNRTGKIV